jgi:TRAP transporter TAXI family solute receptor
MSTKNTTTTKPLGFQPTRVVSLVFFVPVVVRPKAAWWVMVAAIGLMAACGKGSDQRAQFLSIATGGTGGVYYPYGGGIAKILNEHLSGVRATAEVTAASVDNLKLIRDGRADLAFTLADTLADAVNGRGAFEGNAVPVASLAVLYSNATQLVTTTASGISSIGDLRGKTISTGSPGSGTEVIALRVLRAAGIDPDRDLTRQGLGVSESAGALKDAKVAAFFWSGGLPTAAIQDLAHSPGVTIKLLASTDVLPVLRRDYGNLYSSMDVPAGAYKGVAAAVPVIAVANVLVVNTSMPEQLAFDITRLLFEKKPELAAIHPEAENIDATRAAAGSPAAYHQGALRYYKQAGVMVRTQ